MSRVKREASSQITKDDVEDDGHEGDENIDTGPWTRASDDVIAERHRYIDKYISFNHFILPTLIFIFSSKA